MEKGMQVLDSSGAHTGAALLAALAHGPPREHAPVSEAMWGQV